MGACMMVVRTLDVGIPIEIGNNPQIIAETMEDGTNPLMDIDVVNKIFLAIYDDSKVIGIVRLCPDTNNSYEAHIKILPEHRGSKAVEAGHKIWRWIQENLPDCVIYSKVPRCCGSVIRFLELFEFEQTGYIPNIWKKDNKLHDVLFYSREVG